MDLFPGLKYEILGVDYPSVALDRARTGRYTHFDVQRVEEPVDPTLKVPNGRKTFDGAKRRIQRARSELSDMRPSKPSKALLVETPLPAQTRAPLTPHNNVNIKSSADVNITSSDDVNKLAAAAPARSQSPDETAEAPHSEPAAAPAKPPMPPPQRSLSQQFKSSELTETGVEDLERELEALFSLDDMLPTGTGGRGSAR